MLAHTHIQQHKINQASRVMADAIRLDAPGTFIRPFPDHGRPSEPLLTLVLQTSNLTPEAQSFTKQVLHLLANAEPGPQPMPKPELSELCDRGIAAQLSFVESTVKIHL